jgi:hypothetical protein
MSLAAGARCVPTSPMPSRFWRKLEEEEATDEALTEIAKTATISRLRPRREMN